MIRLSGKAVADKIEARIKERIATNGVHPGLAVIVVGDDQASHTYVSLKEKKAKECGIHFEKYTFPENTDEDAVRACIQELNQREAIHGIIIQLPLPGHMDTDALVASIDPSKDTDGFHPVTLEKFLAGDHDRLPVFPRAIVSLIKESGEAVEGKAALAIVNSELLGHVLIHALVDEGMKASYILGDEKPAELPQAVIHCNVLITATGKKHSIQANWCQPKTIIIDGGISYEQGKVYGDVEATGKEDVYLTPIIGGVGPVTVAVLLERVTEAALRP